MLLKEGVFTYRQLMWEIPYSVVLAMINDQGRVRKKKEEEDIPDGMKKLRSIFGGTVAKTSAAAAAAAETEEETAEEEGYAQSIQSGYDENEDDE